MPAVRSGSDGRSRLLGAQGYWSVLQLWEQGLGASAIERIDTGISVIGPGSGSCSSSGNP